MTSSFLAGEDYLALPHDPQPWVIKDLIPVSGLTNVYGKPKTGKALALDTSIPTPQGWRTMADLQVDDLVFGADGRPTAVTAISAVQLDRKCYRVTFGDDTSIVADADHLWEVTKSGKQCPTCNGAQVLTTQQLVDQKTHTNGGKTLKAKWHVRLPEPLEYPAAAPLPVDPYVLGAWLGDGTGCNSQLTSADAELVDTIRAAGWDVVKQPSNDYGYCIRGLVTALRPLGVLNDKHIPASYMTASVADRLALLQGLMDTDGTCEGGSAVFCNTSVTLALQTLQLARGLGLKASWSEGRAKLDGRDIGPKYSVRVRTHLQVFRLPRKAVALRLNTTERYWAITSVEPVASVPVKCITVANADRLYLAGENCIVTHNSFAAIGMAIAVSSGKHEWLGFPVRRHGPVAYLQIDTPRSHWAERLVDIQTAGHDLSKIFFCDMLMAPYPFNALNEEHHKWLCEQLQILRPLVVVIDTLREVHGGDENDSTVMRNVITGLAAAARPAALVLISHARKDNAQSVVGGSDMMDDARGSSYVAGRMDSIIKFTKANMYYKGRSAGNGHISIRQHEETGLVVLDGDAAEYQALLQGRVDEMLSVDGATTVNALATDISARTKYRSKRTIDKDVKEYMRTRGRK